MLRSGKQPKHQETFRLELGQTGERKAFFLLLGQPRGHHAAAAARAYYDRHWGRARRAREETFCHDRGDARARALGSPREKGERKTSLQEKGPWRSVF